jgi:hypothetical protein
MWSLNGHESGPVTFDLVPVYLPATLIAHCPIYEPTVYLVKIPLMAV